MALGLGLLVGPAVGIFSRIWLPRLRKVLWIWSLDDDSMDLQALIKKKNDIMILMKICLYAWF